MGDVGTTGTYPKPHRHNPEPKHCCWRYISMKLMEHHSWAFLGSGTSQRCRVSLYPSSEGCYGAAPNPVPLLPAPPSPGSTFVCVQMFVFPAADENIHYLVSCCCSRKLGFAFPQLIAQRNHSLSPGSTGPRLGTFSPALATVSGDHREGVPWP